MFTFRCTQKLLRRLQVQVDPEPPEPTTRLGDWYANLFFIGPRRWLFFVSERSLLPVFMPLRDRDNLLANFRARLAAVLLALDVPESLVVRELAEMEAARFGRTASRSILASMREPALNAEYRLEMDPETSPLDLALYLTPTPCGPLGYRSPAAVTRDLMMQGGGEA